MLDEKADTPAVNPDDLINIGLAIDLLLLDELPPPTNLTLDSDNGKKPLRRKNDDFMPLALNLLSTASLLAGFAVYYQVVPKSKDNLASFTHHSSSSILHSAQSFSQQLNVYHI
ncbi:hypothetical protein Lal_00046016 [Lupinus albus]|nr:hypothetical protein Lal_00046016 [Lupinus albus]